MPSFIGLVVWGIVWLPFWVMIEIYRFMHRRPRLDNCLSWAARRWHRKGGYLIVRWCRSSKLPWLKWPHFGWMDENDHEKIVHFMPLDQNLDKHYIPNLWFDGRIKRGDPKDDHLEN